MFWNRIKPMKSSCFSHSCLFQHLYRILHRKCVNFNSKVAVAINFHSENVRGRFQNGRLYVWASKALCALCRCGAKKLLHIRHMCGSCGSFLQLLFAPLWHPSLSKPGVRSGQQGENRWQLMQIGKYGNNFFWKYFPLKVLFARTRNFLIKPS